jgi:hypothetical protein
MEVLKTWQYTNTNIMFIKVRIKLNLENVCYRSVQRSLSCHLIYKNITDKIYKTDILSSVLYGSYNVISSSKGRVFENRVLSRMGRPKWKQQEDAGNCILRNFLIVRLATHC